MLLFRRIFALSLFIALGGCGFQPLYKKQQAGDAVIEDLAQVQVLNLIDQVSYDDRLGQKIKNLLLDRLNPGGRPNNPFYVLALTRYCFEAAHGPLIATTLSSLISPL